jgi:hypothetical protein
MAQASKAGMFIVGAEFSRFGDSPLWNGLDQALAKVFHGRLAYSDFRSGGSPPPAKQPRQRGWAASTSGQSGCR